MEDIEKVVCEFEKYCNFLDERCPDILLKVLELLKEYSVIKETISDEIHETAKMFRKDS